MELGAERVAPDEAQAIAAILDANRAMTTRAGATIRRAQHAKHHGCVTARFIVRDDIPAHLAHGVFARAQAFDALVRFSNGAAEDDRTPDAHGLAIKLLDVPGAKLPPGDPDGTEQDFVLVDSPVYFIAGLAEYARFNTAVAAARAGTLGKLRLLARLMTVDLLLKWRLQTFTSKTPGSPLGTDYFSATPYLLGPTAVKYVARAVPHIPGPVTRRDGLRHALRDALATAQARFDFGVQVQSDARAHPVEDPTQPWRGAAEVPLATLEIPVQDTDAGMARGESLVFSPWHCLPDHRPLGAINRARAQVYAALAQARTA